MARSQSAAGASRSRLVIVAALSAAIFVAEIVTGLLTSSLALLADAAHVFTDLTGVLLALAAIDLAERPATERRTYGYYRLEILAAFVNAVVLFAVGGVVLFEAVRRFTSVEPPILTTPMIAVAAVGLVVNLGSALLLREASARSLNMRGAYLEVLSDAFGSAAVIAAGAIIAVTGFRAADAIASIAIGALILPRTWRLLREALDVLLEATPEGVEMAHVRQHIVETPGVVSVHDLHVWTITSGMNVISAHVTVADDADREMVLRELSRCLADDFDIEHSTFQLERVDHDEKAHATHA